jgi:limonene-1,2-epoxide hydrolase
MSENEKVIAAFIAAWSRLNVNELLEFFTEDGVYHNMPMGPVRGKAQLKLFIAAFLKDWSSTQWDVLTLMSKGDTVIAERLDRTLVGDVKVDLPCCGVFRMENGKIAIWRDYFDMANYTKALAS